MTSGTSTLPCIGLSQWSASLPSFRPRTRRSGGRSRFRDEPDDDEDDFGGDSGFAKFDDHTEVTTSSKDASGLIDFGGSAADDAFNPRGASSTAAGKCGVQPWCVESLPIDDFGAFSSAATTAPAGNDDFGAFAAATTSAAPRLCGLNVCIIISTLLQQ